MNDLDLVISDLYDAAMAQSTWNKALKSMGDFANAGMGAIFAHDRFAPVFPQRYDMLASIGYEIDDIKSFARGFTWQDDGWRVPIESTDPFVAQAGSHQGWETEIKKFDYTQEAQKLLDYRDLMWVKLGEGPSIAMLSLYRSSRSEDYSVKDVERFQYVARHLKSALEIHFRFSSGAKIDHGFETLGSRLPYGIAVVNAQGKILHANLVANTAFSKGSVLTSSFDHVRACDQRSDAIFQESVRCVTNGKDTTDLEPHRRVVLLRSNIDSSFTIASISRFSRPRSLLAEQFSTHEPTALIIFASNTIADDIDKSLLQELFGLTPGETEIAFELCRGWSVNQIAEQSDRSVSAVRFHLKSLFAKTSTNSQGDLVHLILTSPAINAVGSSKTKL